MIRLVHVFSTWQNELNRAVECLMRVAMAMGALLGVHAHLVHSFAVPLPRHLAERDLIVIIVSKGYRGYYVWDSTRDAWRRLLERVTAARPCVVLLDGGREVDVSRVKASYQRHTGGHSWPQQWLLVGAQLAEAESASAFARTALNVFPSNRRALGQSLASTVMPLPRRRYVTLTVLPKSLREGMQHLIRRGSSSSHTWTMFSRLAGRSMDDVMSVRRLVAADDETSAIVSGAAATDADTTVLSVSTFALCRKSVPFRCCGCWRGAVEHVTGVDQFVLYVVDLGGGREALVLVWLAQREVKRKCVALRDSVHSVRCFPADERDVSSALGVLDMVATADESDSDERGNVHRDARVSDHRHTDVDSTNESKEEH